MKWNLQPKYVAKYAAQKPIRRKGKGNIASSETPISACNRTIPRSIIFPLTSHFLPPTSCKRAYNRETTYVIWIYKGETLVRTALVMYFPIMNMLNVTISHLRFLKTHYADSIHLRKMPILSSGISNTCYFAFKYINIFQAIPIDYNKIY